MVVFSALRMFDIFEHQTEKIDTHLMSKYEIIMEKAKRVINLWVINFELIYVDHLF